MGAIVAGIKAALNYGAAPIGSSQELSLGTWEAKAKNAVARYTGYSADHGDWDVDRATPTWQGLATTAIMQYADAKTRHYGNISRKKLLDIAEEAIPILQTYEAGGDLGNMAINYNAFTTGYGGKGTWGTYSFDHVKPYATVKAVRIVADFFGARTWINRRLPKGLNL
jgi:hypothetical protein